MRWLACLLLGASACAFFVTPSRDALDRARTLRPKCREVKEDAIAPLLTPDGIETRAPAYQYLPGGPNGGERRLVGSRVVTRPEPGWSAESLARGLECHEARIALGEVPARDEEPFAIPLRWVSIMVEPEGGAFAIVLSSPDFDDAREIERRTRIFYAPPN